MADNRAQITLDVQGGDKARQAAENVGRAWGKAGKDVENAWKSVRNSIAGSVEQGVRDVGRLAFAVHAIDFAGAMRGAVDFRDSVTRMAVAAGKDIDSMRDRFTAVGREILRKPEEVAAFSRGVSKVTYDLGKAADVAKVLGREGLFTDRSLEELQQFAILMSRSTKGVDDMEKSVRKLRGTASSGGMAGGIQALLDFGNTNAGLLGKFSGTLTTGARGEAFAIRSAIGKALPDLSPEEQSEATSGLLSAIANDPRSFERAMGMKWGTLSDKKTGHLKYSPIEALERTQKYVRKLAGGDETLATFSARNKLGQLPGSALLAFSADDARAAMNAPEMGERGAGFLATPAGIAMQARNNSYIAQQQAAGKLADSSWFQSANKFASKNPILAGIAAVKGTELLASGIGAGIRSGIPLAGTAATALGGTIAAHGGAAGLATLAAGGAVVGGAVLGAGAGGYALGSAIDEGGRFSDRIARFFSGGGGGGLYKLQANSFHEGMIQTPDAIRAMSKSTAATIFRNMESGALTREEGEKRLAALDARTKASLRAAGVTGEEVDTPETKSAAQDAQVVADAMAQGWEQALSRKPISITVLNYSGNPIEVVQGDRAYSSYQSP